MSRPCIKIPVRDGSVALIPGDIHGGIHDQPALDLLGEVASVAGANLLLLQGDTHNCGAISPHRKPAKYHLDMGTLAAEDEALAPWVQAWDEVYAIPGNHEDWVCQHVDTHPALHGLIDWYSPFPQTYRDVTVGERHSYMQAGRLYIDHGNNLCGSSSAQAAQNVLRHYPGSNIAFGHTHRLGVCTTPTGKLGAAVPHGTVNLGHVSLPEAHVHYAGGSIDAWEQGGAIVSWFRVPGEPGLFHHIELLRVMRDRRGRPFVSFRGKVHR